jgi:phage terminase Nu1 subunit (DNA packaging protein)
MLPEASVVSQETAPDCHAGLGGWTTNGVPVRDNRGEAAIAERRALEDWVWKAARAVAAGRDVWARDSDERQRHRPEIAAARQALWACR